MLFGAFFVYLSAICVKSDNVLPRLYHTDDCPDLPPQPSIPQDRHHVRPDHIAAVMAIGDDLLTALAAKTDDYHSMAVQEFKGINFANGADSGSITLHNLISRYRNTMNRHGRVKGGSHGAHPVGLCPGGRLCNKHDQLLSYTSPLQDRLNVALSGATVDSLPIQFKELRRQAKRLNVTEQEWKLIVVHIGAVDVCNWGCLHDDTSDSNGGVLFEARVKQLLTSINEHFPRSIVSLMLLADSSQTLPWLKRNKRRCDRDAKRIATAQCPCAMSTDDQSRYAMSASIADLNQRLARLAHSINTDPSMPHLGVHVARPLQDTIYNRHLPPAFLSPLDCLHWTAKGQKALALSMWRDLFVGGVTRLLFEEDTEVYCPGEQDYIQLYTMDPDHAFEL